MKKNILIVIAFAALLLLDFGDNKCDGKRSSRRRGGGRSHRRHHSRSRGLTSDRRYLAGFTGGYGYGAIFPYQYPVSNSLQYSFDQLTCLIDRDTAFGQAMLIPYGSGAERTAVFMSLLAFNSETSNTLPFNTSKYNKNYFILL